MNIRNPLKIDIAPNRVYGLDILRAIAILFVMFLHGCFITPNYISNIVGIILSGGVSIFLVISGFLVGGIIIKIFEKEKPTIKTLLGFWKRRWFRILPNYYLILIIHIIIAYIFWDRVNPHEYARYFFFLQNFAWPHPWFFAESWSLSVQEWFYLLIPIVIFLLINFTSITCKRSFLFSAIFLIIAVTAFRYGKFVRYTNNYPELIDPDMLFGHQVVTRWDSVLYGVIVAYLSFYYKNTLLKYKNQLFMGGVVLFVIYKIIIALPGYDVNGLFSCVFSYSVFSLIVAMLLPFFSNFKTGKGFVYKSITYISLISYSMYLLHLSFIQWSVLGIFMKDFFAAIAIRFSETASWITEYILYWVLTIVLAILLYKYFEIPVTNRLNKKKLKPTENNNK